MRKELLSFNELYNTRYSDFVMNNVTQVIQFTFSASPTWELALNITYETLDKHLREHFNICAVSSNEDGSGKLQQYRNHRSTLTGFIGSVGKTNESRVGAELGSAFDTALSRYLDMVNVSSRAKSDRRAHLKLIKKLYEKPEQDRKADKSANFKDTLRAAIASTGMPAKTLAKKIGVSTSAVQRWLAGAVPNRRGIPTLRRLESELGLERDSLVKLVPEQLDSAQDIERPEKASGSPLAITHRARMA